MIKGFCGIKPAVCQSEQSAIVINGASCYHSIATISYSKTSCMGIMIIGWSYCIIHILTGVIERHTEKGIRRVDIRAEFFKANAHPCSYEV